MPSENIREIDQVQNQPVLMYGVLRSDPRKVMPIELDDNGNVYVNTDSA